MLSVSKRSAAAARISATCQASDAVGALVYAKAADEVETCDPTDLAKMPAMGIILSKPTSTTAIVQVSGEVLNVSGLTVGRQFVGSSGTPAASSPVPAVSASVFVQAIGVALDGDRLILSPSFSMHRKDG